jgi:hypothetical protein
LKGSARTAVAAPVMPSNRAATIGLNGGMATRSRLPLCSAPARLPVTAWRAGVRLPPYVSAIEGEVHGLHRKPVGKGRHRR